MAASQSFDFCGPCSRDNEDSQVAQWCTDCNEGLCQSCTKHHRRSLASCKHHLIDKNDISDVLPVLQELPQTCLTHENQPLSWFCKAHDVICCLSCIQREHSNCLCVISIEDASKDVAKSAALLQLKDRMNGTKKNVSCLVDEVNKNVTDIATQRKNIEKEITDIRSKLNNRLDLMESITRSQLDSHLGTTNDRVQRVSNQLNDQLITNITMIRHLSLIEQTGSETQLFRLIKYLDLKQNAEEKTSLQIDKDFKVISLSFSQNNNLLKVIKHSNSFCDVSMKIADRQTLTRRSFTGIPQTQFQYLKPPPNLVERQVVKSECIAEGLPVLRCCFLGNNQFIIRCYKHDTAIICDNSFNVLGKLKANTYLKYVSFVSVSEAAMTDRDGYVHLINTNTYSSIKSVKLGSECDGVTTFKDNILVCVDKKITIVNHDLEGVKAIPHDGKATNLVCNNRGQIFYYHCDDNYLSCIKFDGSPVFKTELVNFDSPSSIAIDKYSRVYIVSANESSVRCVSSDGEKQLELLSGVLSTPTSIDISGETVVVIDGAKGNVRLYSLE